MMFENVFVFIFLFIPVLSGQLKMFEISVPSEHLNIVTRKEWKARKPKETSDLKTPVPLVVIHHTYQPAICHTLESCEKAMRSIQNFHMDEKGWNDIGYNFCVGGDGNVYEGRGWQTLGAHCLNFNSCSIGICLIGDFSFETPPDQQLNAAKQLIQLGLQKGMISKSYILTGHRNLRDTECPGDALYALVQKWDHYKNINKTDTHC